MMKRIDALKACFVFCILLTGFSGTLLGQERFGHADSLTYRYYVNQQWDSLVAAGRKALRNGIDYYYLRSRMGTAYQALGKPFLAVGNFSRALEFDHYQAYAWNGLYHSCLDAGLSDQARAITTHTNAGAGKTTESQIPALQEVYVEIGGSLSNAYQHSNPENLMGADSLYGEQDLYGNDYYAHLSFVLNITPYLNLYLGCNYLNFAKRKLFQYSVYTDHLDSTVTYDWGYQNYYSFPRQTTSSAFTYNLTQTEFALGATLTSATGVKVVPMFKWIRIGYYNTQALVSSSVVTDTLYYVTATNTYSTFPFTRVQYGYVQRDTSLNNFLVSLLTSRQFGILTLGMGGSWSDLNGSQQAEVSAFGTYYPLGNLDLYGTTEVIGLFQGTVGRVILYQRVGGRIWKDLWGDASVLYGDITNGNLSNGMIVYNNVGKVAYRLGAELIYQVSKRLGIYLNYQYMEQSGPIYYYADETTASGQAAVLQTRWMPYLTNSLFLGAKITL